MATRRKTVKVLGQKVEVRFVPNVDKAIADMGGGESKGLVGHAELTKGLVLVGVNQSDDQIADTVLHELLHIMLMFVGRDDEEVVFRLAPILLDFMRSNPTMVEYLLGNGRRIIR